MTPRRESDGRLVKAENRQAGLVKLSTYKVLAYIVIVIMVVKIGIDVTMVIECI